jgi:hypothetical protein
VLSFGSYINSSLKQDTEIKAADVQKDSVKNGAVDMYYLN